MPTLNYLSLLILSSVLLTACSKQVQNEALSNDSRATQITQEGVPGGVATQVEEINAVVSAINYATSSVTLEDAQGHQRDFKASSEMIDLQRLKVGDKVNATVVLEQMIYLRDTATASTDSAADILATTPANANPGMLVAESVEIIAVVKAIDTTQQTATLEFGDGTRKTVKVRPDVQLKTEHLNRQVMIRLSSALAIRVQPE